MKKVSDSGRGGCTSPASSLSLYSTSSSTICSGFSCQAWALGVSTERGVGGIGGSGILLEVSRSRPDRVRSSNSQDLEGWASRVGLDLGASKASCWRRSSMVERGTLGTMSDTWGRNKTFIEYKGTFSVDHLGHRKSAHKWVALQFCFVLVHLTYLYVF